MPARFFSYLDEDAYFFRLASTPVVTRRLTDHRAGARNSVRRSALTGFCGQDRDQRRIAKNGWVSPVAIFALMNSNCRLRTVRMLCTVLCFSGMAAQAEDTDALIRIARKIHRRRILQLKDQRIKNA